METSLHRQLKLHYAASSAHTEIGIGGFRIDAVSLSNELVEIQHASLGALKVKLRRLLEGSDQHSIRVVKPIVARKWITTLESPAGPLLRRRLSPKRGHLTDIFADLVHFTTLFPHPRLTLEVVLVDAEEIRIPKLRARFRRKNYTTLEQTLLAMNECVELRSAHDLWRLMPKLELPLAYDTAELARQMDRPRWLAQKAAYCLRSCSAIRIVGKRGNNQLYQNIKPPRSRKQSRLAS